MKDLDYNYDIIGNTKTKSNILYYEQLENLIKTKNYKNIHLLKNLERKNLVEKVNKSKVYFHGSKETFGISTVESIAKRKSKIQKELDVKKKEAEILAARAAKTA